MNNMNDTKTDVLEIERDANEIAFVNPILVDIPLTLLDDAISKAKRHRKASKDSGLKSAIVEVLTSSSMIGVTFFLAINNTDQFNIQLYHAALGLSSVALFLTLYRVYSKWEKTQIENEISAKLYHSLARDMQFGDKNNPKVKLSRALGMFNEIENIAPSIPEPSK